MVEFTITRRRTFGTGWSAPVEKVNERLRKTVGILELLRFLTRWSEARRQSLGGAGR